MAYNAPITGINITTSNDIFIEVSGKRIAGVQSYSTKYNKDTKPVDVFGQDVPIGYLKGKKKYTLDLSRVYLEDTAANDGVDFYSLADNQFNVVIIKNGKRVTYGDCIVTDVNEDGSLNDKVVEKMTISALTRRVG